MRSTPRIAWGSILRFVQKPITAAEFGRAVREAREARESAEPGAL